MKYILLLIISMVVGCAVDTGVDVADGIDVDTTHQLYRSSSSSATTVRPVSSSSVSPRTTFPTELSYIAINKDPNGVNLVMKNNMPSNLYAYVNYTITCSVNGGSATTTVKTVYFSFSMFEQKEYKHMDGYYHGGMKTIECSGYITSIRYGVSSTNDFQPWVGNYPISTH